MTTSPYLSLENVHAGYGKLEVLHSISLNVQKGEIVCVLGANGAGKSTTLMCVAGVRPITQGKITLGDISLNLPAHEIVTKGLALVPEGRRIFPRLTVMDNLLLGSYTRSDTKEISNNLDRVLTLFPILAERRNQSGGTLSGGEQQMLAIGRALMSDPSILLLDEPSMGIAPILVQKIFETLVNLNSQGLTILLVEQNAHLALGISKRAYVIETGEIVLSGTSKELLEDSRVQEAYLGA